MKWVCSSHSALHHYSFVQFRLCLANVELILFCSPNIYSAKLKLNELVMYYKCLIFHFHIVFIQFSVGTRFAVMSCWHTFKVVGTFKTSRNIFTFHRNYPFTKVVISAFFDKWRTMTLSERGDNETVNLQIINYIKTGVKFLSTLYFGLCCRDPP